MNETWWVKQEQLDEGQKAVIDLPLDQSHLIVGPPGSGKTNLLLLRGSQLVRSNKPNVLILTFTRTLREFVASRGFRQSHASFLRVELAPSVTTVIRPPGGPSASDQPSLFEEESRQSNLETERLRRLVLSLQSSLLLAETLLESQPIPPAGLGSLSRKKPRR